MLLSSWAKVLRLLGGHEAFCHHYGLSPEAVGVQVLMHLFETHLQSASSIGGMRVRFRVVG